MSSVQSPIVSNQVHTQAPEMSFFSFDATVRRPHHLAACPQLKQQFRGRNGEFQSNGLFNCELNIIDIFAFNTSEFIFSDFQP